MKLYIVSGLGAYKKVFSNIRFPKDITPVFLEWKLPHPTETLEQYVQKFVNEIDVNSDFMLLGYSFGGIIVQEIHKKYPAKKVIILASLRSENEKTPFLKFLQKVPLHRFVPKSVFVSSTFIRAIMRNPKALTKANALQDTYFEFTNSTYLKWSIKQYIEWKNPHPDKEIIHINAENDILLPKKASLANVLVPKASHLFLITHHKIISKLLEENLK